MKPLLIGQAPGASAASDSPALGPEPPGGAGARLAELLDVPDVRELFDAVNLLDRFPGRLESQNGDVWPLAEARAASARLDLTGRPFTILVGLNVARAFGIAPVPFRWFALPCRDFYATDVLGRQFWPVAVVPHTSGVNRFYNDPENRDRARRFLRAALDFGPVYDAAEV